MFRYLGPLLIFCGVLHFKIEAQHYTDSTITIYFNSGEFSPTLMETNKLRTTLNGLNFILKSISGYTDSVGSFESNIILSRKRSQNISFLLQQHFKLPEIYSVENLGEQYPVSHADNSLNRRVEVLLSVLKTQNSPVDTSKRIVLKTYRLDKLYFRPDEPIIEPSSMPYLDYVAKILKIYTSGIFEIRGHINWDESVKSDADSGYRKKMNELSTARAKLVYDILIDKGIPPERMNYKGVGNTQMIYPNAGTDEEKRKNMRVEILILKDPGK